MTRNDLIEKLARLKSQEARLNLRIADRSNRLIEAESELYEIEGEIERAEKEVDDLEIAEAKRREQADAMEDHIVGDLEDQLERLLP